MIKNLPGRPLAGIAGPFSGFKKIRILDFSKLLPGPFASQLLADLGCEVVSVELPYFGDLTRELPPKIDGVGFAYWMVNQGKKKLSFDFRTPQGLRRLKGLVKRSDVILEGFRPGLMDRIGLGYDEARRLRPGLVYCSITGYDRNGAWGRRAAHDLNFLAVSGYLGVGNSEGSVAFPAVQMGDMTGSLAAVIGILGGLLERRLLGKKARGRHISISMADALHSLFSIPLGYLEATGSEPPRGRTWWSGGHPFYRLYRTKDGRHMAVAAVETGFAVSLLDELGLSRRRRHLPAIDAKNFGGLARAMESIFRKRTLAEWEERLKDKDVCVTPVYSLKEASAALRRSRVPVARGRPLRRPKK